MKKSTLFARYKFALIAIIIFILILVSSPFLRHKSVSILIQQSTTMFLVVPPIFLLLGLLDVWVPRESFIRYMGERSGFTGTLIAFALGSAAAGPLYGAFPVASILMKKGASFSNILIFIGAWSTTKIPMLLFEMHALGTRFALSRLFIDIIGIIVIALLTKWFIKPSEVEQIYLTAAQRD
ncbi:permease [Gracilinema caldarium]|uniref:permease n=1 Tax=Gracilinema caldarium TaxID=215591 RepID=UPI0026F2D8D7|nr:permease [Gracilinema caldarium]